MVDPQAKGKVRARLRTTLVETEVRVSKAAETITMQATKLAVLIAEKRNGNGRTEPGQP